jgi:putative ABC transport system ATP-binding protein
LVLIDGTDAAAAGEAARSRLRRRVGFAFTGGPMIPSLPLWENVTVGLVPLGIGAPARRATAMEVLERLGLGAKLRAVPEELSTGELGRASLARAMASRPEAILADEPLANLDDAAQSSVVEALAALHRCGTTLVVATHAVRAFPFATASCRLGRGRRVDAEPA